MNKKQIGFLHPGAMGISLAVASQKTGHTAYWISEQRSESTRQRAEKNRLVEALSIEELCDRCDMIISVCPPHAATDVAKQVLSCAFKGIYADVNAISPQRVEYIGRLMENGGVEFVDGGIIGPPAWQPNTTWLYLSGRAASQVAVCFEGGLIVPEIIGNTIGKASALKMCFAANSKGTTALLCAIVAAAEKMGVRRELETQWSRNDSELAENILARITHATAKAWRFSGEMEEIASTLERAGLPNGFHLAASDVYQRIAKFKGAESTPPLKDVLDALLNPEESQKTFIGDNHV